MLYSHCHWAHAHENSHFRVCIYCKELERETEIKLLNQSFTEYILDHFKHALKLSSISVAPVITLNGTATWVFSLAHNYCWINKWGCGCSLEGLQYCSLYAVPLDAPPGREALVTLTQAFSIFQLDYLKKLTWKNTQKLQLVPDATCQ